MTVDANGWLDWCIKLPATVNHVNGGTNTVNGLFMHSAEGFASTLLDPHSKWGYNGDLSWHLTNTLDGERVYQHYPFTAQCWHATAANNTFVGMENEGLTPQGAKVGPVLNSLQIAKAKRVIADLSAWKGWVPRRPVDANDKTASLYQHGEVVRFGGTGSSCPNGRIPWDKILGGNMADGWVKEGHAWTLYNEEQPVLRIGSVDGSGSPGMVSKNFGGVWYNLSHLKQDDDPGPGQQSPAVWSNTLSD